MRPMGERSEQRRIGESREYDQRVMRTQRGAAPPYKPDASEVDCDKNRGPDRSLREVWKRQKRDEWNRHLRTVVVLEEDDRVTANDGMYFMGQDLDRRRVDTRDLA